MLIDLQPDTVSQGELDLQSYEAPDRSKLMLTVDGLNQRYRNGVVLMASAGVAGERRAWVKKRQRRTPAYTTCWNDLAIARA